MRGSGSSNASADPLSLDSIRRALVRQEDTIIFSLIERARFPLNAKAYLPQHDSLARRFIKQTEALEATFGRYQNPEETPFFPDSHQPPAGALHPAGAWVNASSQIWDMYMKQLLPSFTARGDDSNYASAMGADLGCLQALARRIHYGRFVAEAKFRAAPHQYIPLIRAGDKDGLTKLLTDDKVEGQVKRRVGIKAMVFGQDVTLQALNSTAKPPYKVRPAVVSGLYSEWVIPLTKQVELQYLLRRLDN